MKTYSFILRCFIYLIPAQAFAKPSGGHANKNEIDPFVWLLIIVSSCILVVLLYVSWKKYRGEVKRKTKKKSDR